MHTIILPGYSPKNKEWAEATRDQLKAKGLDAEVYEWKHWKDLNIRFSAKEEAENIKKLVVDKPVNIIAKSIGTLVAVEMIKASSKVVFCGVPVNDLNEQDSSEYKVLSDINPDKIIVFQNSQDEHGSFEEARRFLSQYNPNVKIIEKPGSTHEYPYYEEFEEFLKE